MWCRAGRALLLNEPVVIDFRPAKSRDIAFGCGMNMLKGVVVVEWPSSTAPRMSMGLARWCPRKSGGSRSCRGTLSRSRELREVWRWRPSEPPPCGDRALTTHRDAVIYRRRSLERGANSRAVRSNKNRGTSRHTTKRANFLGILEAPPGFEPGMEVLQTVQGCAS
jgi:hypothetical protein